MLVLLSSVNSQMHCALQNTISFICCFEPFFKRGGFKICHIVSLILDEHRVVNIWLFFFLIPFSKVPTSIQS